MRRQFVGRARSLRKRLTPSERTIWHWLRHRLLGGHKFRRQHPLNGYILDFYCADLKLCIEVDGGVHNQPARVAHDVQRTQRLRKLDVEVVRLLNEHIAEQPDGAWSLLVQAVESREKAVGLLASRDGQFEGSRRDI